MIWLILGLALWWGAHLFKRIAPEARTRMGDRAKGPVALALLLSIVLMVIGYRATGGPVWWGRTPMLTGINNLLVLLAFYLFAASGMKTGLTRRLRHPQLTGFSLWAVAHLLVNGDFASLMLFGGLLLWALVEIWAINRAGTSWTPPHPVPIRKEAMAVAGAVVAFGLVAAIHAWLGYNPFG